MGVKNLYFTSKDGDLCYTKSYFQELMETYDLKEMTLYKAERDYVESRAKKSNAIDVIKSISAIRENDNFYCAKTHSIQKQAKCNEQCLLCRAGVNQGMFPNHNF